MAGHEFSGFQAKESGTGSVKSQLHALITLERSQKFDLLVHLIANLKQSLIVCGPLGIGKSTLLRLVQDKASPDWYCCYVEGGPQWSFESISERLMLFLSQQGDDRGSELNEVLQQLSRQRQKLVLIIDDAGLLVPGLIDALTRYAFSYPALRIIFALTQDELYIKSRSDQTTEDCHFIELPPLSERQCGEFLRSLSGNPQARLALGAFDDRMVAKLYQETHGIPGKMVAELPRLPHYGKSHTLPGFPVMMLALTVSAAGLAYWFWQESSVSPSEVVNVDPLPPPHSAETLPAEIQRANDERANTVVATDDVESRENDVAVPPPENIARVLSDQANPGAVALLDHNGTDKTEGVTTDTTDAVDEETASSSNEVEISAEEKPVATNASEPETDPGPSPNVAAVEVTAPVNDVAESEPSAPTDDRQWLFAQASNHYTLQLIVLSKRPSLMRLLEQYRNLQSLKHIELRDRQRAKYILLYGAFDSYAEAGKAMRKLPKAFRKSWIRRFKSLQNDVKSSQ